MGTTGKGGIEGLGKKGEASKWGRHKRMEDGGKLG